jgi:hypothetical protein
MAAVSCTADGPSGGPRRGFGVLGIELGETVIEGVAPRPILGVELGETVIEGVAPRPILGVELGEGPEHPGVEDCEGLEHLGRLLGHDRLELGEQGGGEVIGEGADGPRRAPATPATPGHY